MKKLPRLTPLAGGMKFATQISPLLNYYYYYPIICRQIWRQIGTNIEYF